MALSDPYFLGQDLTNLTVAGGTRNADGTITYATATTIGNSVDYFRVSATHMSEMIVPVNATKAHYEKTINDSNMVVGEIKKRKTNGLGSVLAAIAFAYDYCRVQATGNDGVTYQMDGLIGTLSDGVTSIGKNGVELSLLQTNLTLSGGLTRTQA